MYTIESSLFKNVNHFLRRFPIEIVDKFMSEVGGIVRYIYLLQSSIECYSQSHPLESDIIAYRGISSKGTQFAPLYESMIDEVIVWSGFTSTSTDRDCVIQSFIKNENSILFKITLHAGDSAALISEYSEYRFESEILIAASSGFKVENVEYIDCESNESNSFRIPFVSLSYCLSWYDFDIDKHPSIVMC
jgi:hypothetical protein